MDDQFRASREALDDYYIRAGNGELVPLSSVVSFTEEVEPSNRTQFNQLNSLTLEGVVMPGVAAGTAMEFMEQTAGEVFPQGFSFDYTGESRQLATQGSRSEEHTSELN